MRQKRKMHSYLTEQRSMDTSDTAVPPKKRLKRAATSIQEFDINRLLENKGTLMMLVTIEKTSAVNVDTNLVCKPIEEFETEQPIATSYMLPGSNTAIIHRSEDLAYDPLFERDGQLLNV
ncbi:uncharacterized protein LOC129720808 [Wyeomyia smithii]|uniref:uncharacterized protein LOC129720808 n=1 Tax=Wyeomyia smithii TaxID=174621 RepID=UPI002467C874|nr:uncharacterized protein LOC129720808 [Wyeomyia smithii]